MTLIKSISGIRGTIGGKPNEGLTPLDIVKFTSAFAAWLSTQSNSKKIVIGRDARISGEMVNQLVTGTLTGMGFNVIDIGLSTTPTVEMAVPEEKAALLLCLFRRTRHAHGLLVVRVHPGGINLRRHRHRQQREERSLQQ